jgi:hypothetical protein
MNHRVGIWIDHRKAVIVSASAERLTSMTLESDVGPPACDSGHVGYLTPDGPQDPQGGKKQVHRNSEHFDQYYDEVITQLGQPDALLIFGPGEAKLQLSERLSRFNALPACIVGIETTDTLTDPQIVAKVRKHYGIVPPGSSAAPARVRSGTQ